MDIEHKGYRIWTAPTSEGFQARVRRFDGGPMAFSGGPIGHNPVNHEFATMENMASEEAAVSEVNAWIDSGRMK